MSNFNFINGSEMFNVPTNNHNLIGWEDCSYHLAVRWHIADEIPGVSCWVVLMNGR